jgi:outer membrane protein assembly factor BamA
LYYNQGFPFIKVERDTSFESDSFINLTERINANKRVLIKQIRIEGNHNVRDGILFKEILINPPEYFNYNKILESIQRIYSLRFFRSVNYKIENDSILVLQVVEVPQRYLETNMGFTYPYFLNLSFLIGHLNIFGNAQNLEVGLNGLFSYSDNKILLNDRSININYKERYFLDRRNLFLNASIIYSKYGQIGQFEDYGKTEEFSLNSEIIRQFSRYFYTNFGISLKRTTILGYEESRIILSFSQRASYDDRNSYLDATKGFLLSFSISEAFGQAQFIKLNQIYSKYFYSFAFRIRSGQIFGKDIPYSEKFFLGGEGSVRGYLNNSIGESVDNLQPASNHFINGNFEYRWRFNNFFGIVYFYDFAIVSNEFEKIFKNKVYSGYGLGFRFYINFIPIRFDFAINPDSKIFPRDILVYFSIGNMF